MDAKHLYISGINFTIECRDAEVSQPVDSAYASFKIKSADSFEDIPVAVYLETDRLPEINGSKKIFDSELSWSVFLDQGVYYISLQPKGFDNPIWLATVDLESSTVTVYCSKKLGISQRGIFSLIVRSAILSIRYY
jgi:hypothetical protein